MQNGLCMFTWTVTWSCLVVYCVPKVCMFKKMWLHKYRADKGWKIKLSDSPAAVKGRPKLQLLRFLPCLASNALSCCILDFEQLLCWSVGPGCQSLSYFLHAGMAGTLREQIVWLSFSFLQPTLFPIWSECNQLSVDSKEWLAMNNVCVT